MPEADTELLVAGSIALDTIEGPDGTVEDELGGSALYFALAASLIMPVRVLAPVGVEDAPRVRALAGSRPIDLTLLTIVDAPTYRWRAQQVGGRNIDLGSRDSIYDLWHPAVPERYSGWAFVGSVRPDRQVELVRRLAGARLLAADSMISYIHSRTDDAFEVVRATEWYFCNHEEFGALGGDDPEGFRRKWELRGLVIKSGPDGMDAYAAGDSVHVPALPGHRVADTTGAGDAVAAGMLARWLSTGGAPDGWVEALAWGVACASITIEEVGLRAIAAATRDQLEERVAEVKEWMRRVS
ncbi:MAG TPA: PfkB family carbohydrate kinase [Candidatus Sulfotelmatobacter sp.]|nr:PfkB family carbohydrate kinase [Candidatus Sulfotelmatobacter sp.]